MSEFTVTFEFEEKEKTPLVLKAHKGETILELTFEHNIELHHNCGGVCACTTCHVYVLDGMKNLSEMTDREEDYVDRAIDPRINSRLACQCIIKGDIKVKVPNQKLMIGH